MTYQDLAFRELLEARQHNRCLGTILCCSGVVLLFLAFLAVYSITVGHMGATGVHTWTHLPIVAFIGAGVWLTHAGIRLVLGTSSSAREAGASTGSIYESIPSQASLPNYAINSFGEDLTPVSLFELDADDRW